MPSRKPSSHLVVVTVRVRVRVSLLNHNQNHNRDPNPNPSPNPYSSPSLGFPPHADDGADDEQEHATHRRGHVERREQVERREEHDGGDAEQRGDDREVRTLQDAVARVPPCPQGGGNSRVGRRPLTNLP